MAEGLMAVVRGARATHTTLECRNVTASLAFYRDVMGLDVNPVGALVGHAWGTNGHYFAVLQSAEVTQQPLLNFYARPVAHARDVDAAHAKIAAVREAYGVRELTTPAREDAAKFGVGTYGFYLNDLDGNWWRIEENAGPFGPAELPPAGAGQGGLPSIVPRGPISYVVLETVRLSRSVPFYRDFLGMIVERPAPHFALCTSAAGWVKALLVEVGDALVPQKVNNHHGLTLEGPTEVIDDARRAAVERSDTYEIRKVLPATRQHGSYAFYMQDADTNCWELEVWDDGISPVQQQLALRASKGAL
jgi:catechol 2,3-dioxygenase-like lactoylglutathione lyase family enzyme